MTGKTNDYFQAEISDSRQRNTIDESAWFQRWFNTSFYHQLYANRDQKEAADFIDELVWELNPTPDSRILDLGCGNGRHSKRLLSKGFDVTGIDLASSSIREAKKWETSTLRFYRQDMRMPFGKNSFDYIFNFFTSFGYFKDSFDDQRVVHNISSALKPGGLVVMDYINFPYAERNLKASEIKEIDGVVYHITRWSDDKFIYKRIMIEEHLFGKPLIYTEQIRKFTVEDFDGLFRNSSLHLMRVFGDYKLGEYDRETSPRLILIAKKMV